MFLLVNKAQKPKIKEKYRRLTLVHPLQKFTKFLNIFEFICYVVIKAVTSHNNSTIPIPGVDKPIEKAYCQMLVPRIQQHHYEFPR